MVKKAVRVLYYDGEHQCSARFEGEDMEVNDGYPADNMSGRPKLIIRARTDKGSDIHGLMSTIAVFREWICWEAVKTSEDKIKEGAESAAKDVLREAKFGLNWDTNEFEKRIQSLSDERLDNLARTLRFITRPKNPPDTLSTFGFYGYVMKEYAKRFDKPKEKGWKSDKRIQMEQKETFQS